MATSRGERSPSPKSPPYEPKSSSQSRQPQTHLRGPYLSTILVRSSRNTRDSTIPKSAEAGEISSERQDAYGSKHTQGSEALGSQYTCTLSGHNCQRHHHNYHRQLHSHSGGSSMSARKQSLGPQLPPANGSDGRHHDQFLESLSAPKSFLGHISIEPFAFLAILALYIEFPAIQDLIYTKICLEVIGMHPNLTTSAHEPFVVPTQTILTSLNQQNHYGNTSNLTASLDNANRSLPSNGRIQQLLSLSSNLGYDNNKQLTSSQIIPSFSAADQNENDNHKHRQREQHLLCNRLNKTAVPRELRQEILDIDSLFWLKYQILVCLLCALASPYWGGLSDKIGRLIPLNAPIVASVLGNAISLIFGLLISMDSHSMFHINWLYTGGVLVGLSGGQAVLIMNSFSFLSDNTTSEERSKRVTTLESVIFVAHSVGFFLSKMIMLLGLSSPDKPWLNRHFVAFTSCVVLNIMALLYSAFKLRHHKFHKFLNNYERERQEDAIMGSNSSFGTTSASLAIGVRGPGKRNGGGGGSGVSCNDLDKACGGGGGGGGGERLRELTSSTPDDPDGPIARSDKPNWSFWDTMVTFKYYKETFEIAFKPRETRSTILLLLLSGFVSSLSLAALMSLFFVYVKMEPFNWTTSQYSSWNSISSITRGVALISLTILMKFAPAWNVPDSIVAGIGFLGKGAGLLMIGLAHSTVAINWSLVAFTFSEYSMPPIRSLLSKLVIRDELGKVYSCLGTLQSLCFILGNIVFYVAFTSFTQQEFFRISFLVVGGIELCAVVIMLAIYSSR